MFYSQPLSIISIDNILGDFFVEVLFVSFGSKVHCLKDSLLVWVFWLAF